MRPICTVLGGTGRIGRGLVESLRDREFTVRAASRRASASSSSDSAHVHADVSDARSLTSAISGSQAVYQLTTAATDDPYDLHRDIVGGTENVIKACLAAGVGRYIFVSSIAALYLGKPDRSPETSDPKPFFRNYYARYKILAEEAVRTAFSRHGLPAIIVRPGIVLGPGHPVCHSGFGHWVSDICCVGFGSGTNALPLVLNEDVVTALVRAADQPGIEGMEFNLAGDVKLSAREFIGLAAEFSKRRFQFFARGLMTGYVEDLSKWLIKTAIRKPWNRLPYLYDRKSMMCLADVNSDLARNVLGWRPNADRDYFLQQSIESNLRVADTRHSLAR